jgi:predicted ATPase
MNSNNNAGRVSMEKFSRLKAKAFRRLFDIDIPLKPLTVMIGANGVGKTSILDIVDLLAVSANGGLNKRINELSGIGAILTIDRSKDLFFELDMPIIGYEPLKYSISLETMANSFAIASEQLSQERGRGSGGPFLHINSYYDNIKYHDIEKKTFVHPTWEHNYLETSLSQVPKMYNNPEDFRKRLASSTFYHVLNVDPRAPVRLPQPLRPAVLPGKNGEDIVSCLFNLRETNRDRFETVEDTLKAAFPGFERLDFPPVAAGTLAMTWKEKNYTTPIYMHQLSEGILRFLWLVTLLQSPGLTAVTLLDEPEVSLHPELLSQLADLFREASTRSQILVATHSDRLVKFLKPEEVLVMDLNEDGTTSAQWADTLDLQKWLDEYTLDELWRMGRMGGRA